MHLTERNRFNLKIVIDMYIIIDNNLENLDMEIHNYIVIINRILNTT